MQIKKINDGRKKDSLKVMNSIFLILYNFILYYIKHKDIINKLKNIIINNMNKIIMNYYKKIISYISIIQLNNKCIKIKFNNNEIFYINKNKYLKKKVNKIFIIYYFILIKIVSIESNSTITLFIEGNASSQILNNDFKNKPCEIIVNNQEYYNNSQYNIDNLNNGTNNITIIWNEKITNCYKMFEGLNNIKSIDFSKFDASNVENMANMFNKCSSLNYLNLSNFTTANVNNMENMFNGCSSLNYIDLSNFNTSKVEIMKNMFGGCSSLLSLDLNKFNTAKVNNMNNMFAGCSSLLSLDLNNFDTTNVVNMGNMFAGCNLLSSLDFNNFNTSKVDNMENMFARCHSFTSLNLSHFDTSNVKYMANMFGECIGLNSLDLNNFNIINVNTMENMFNGCSSLKSLNLSHFDTSKDVNMANMFNGCTSLRFLDLSSSIILSLLKINSMFFDCSVFFENFYSFKVTRMENMFDNCQSLTIPNLLSLNSSVTTLISELFRNSLNLQFINISNFNIPKNMTDNEIIDSTPENSNIYIYKNNTEHNNFSYECGNRCNQECPKGTYSNEFCSSNNTSNEIILCKEIYRCKQKDYFLGKCKLDNTTTQNEPDEIINNIKNGITNGELDELITEVVQNENKDLLIQDNNLLYQITSSENQIKNKNNFHYSSWRM